MINLNLKYNNDDKKKVKNNWKWIELEIKIVG